MRAGRGGTRPGAARAKLLWAGAIAIFVYLLIAISQLILRKKYERECPEKLKNSHVEISGYIESTCLRIMIRSSSYTSVLLATKTHVWTYNSDDVGAVDTMKSTLIL